MGFGKVLLTGVLGCSLVVGGLFAEQDSPKKCTKKCWHEKTCRKGECCHKKCRVHKRCCNLCQLDPVTAKKEAEKAITKVQDKEVKASLITLYDNIKEGKFDYNEKVAVWKILRVMKAYWHQDEHKKGHMVCPRHKQPCVATAKQPCAKVKERKHHRHHDHDHLADGSN